MELGNVGEPGGDRLGVAVCVTDFFGLDTPLREEEGFGTAAWTVRKELEDEGEMAMMGLAIE